MTRSRKDGEQLLSVVGRYCDPAALQSLRLTSLALHNALSPVRVEVKGDAQLKRFAVAVCSRDSRLKRDALRHLTLSSCNIGSVVVASLLVIARRLPTWAPQLLSVTLDIKQDGACLTHEPYFLREAVSALRSRVNKLSLRLVDMDDELESLCGYADELTMVSPRTLILITDPLPRLKRLIIETDKGHRGVACRTLTALEEFRLASSDDYQFRTLNFIPDGIKKLTLPWSWLQTDAGDALLARCNALEELVVYGADDILRVDKLDGLMQHGECRVKFEATDGAFINVCSDASWRFLEKMQHRLHLEDIELYVYVEDAPPRGVVLTVPRRAKVYCRSGGVPMTSTMRAFMVRWLRRVAPHLDTLELMVQYGEEFVPTTSGNAEWEQVLRTAEAQELRAAEEQLRTGLGAPWPSQRLVLHLDKQTADMALLFPMTPTVVIGRTFLPPSNLAIAAPGLRTLEGMPHMLARAIDSGLGGITCMRIIDPGSATRIGVAGVVAALEKTHGRLQKLQLVRNGRGEAWWDDEDVEDIEDGGVVLSVEVV